MQEGNQKHSEISNNLPDNNKPNGQVSSGNSGPFIGDQNNLGSLNVNDDLAAQNASDKPISEISNLNYTNSTNTNLSNKIKKPSNLIVKYLTLSLLGFVLMSVIGFGAYKLVSSSNKQKASTLASTKVSKTISLNVPLSNNQASLTPAQIAGQSISLNGDVAIQGSLNTTGAIKTSSNITGGNLSIQGNIVTGGTITASSLSGNGSALTAINANNITSGTINTAQLPSNVTQLGQSIPLSAIQANIVSSINGIINNGGNIDVVGSGNISVVNDTATNTLTISSTAGGTLTGVTVGTGLTGGGTTGNVLIGLDGSVTLQGNTFNGANDLVQLNSSAQLPVLDATNLTNINASNISSGTIDNARLTGDVTLQGNTFNGASQLVQVGSDGKLTTLDGSNLTNLNGANLQTGSVPDSALSSNVCLGSTNNCNYQAAGNYQVAGNYINLQSATPGTPQNGNINVSGSVIAGSFKGDGSQINNINGSNVSTGTVSDSRLSNNVTVQGNTFNGNNELVQTNNSGTINDSLLTSNVCLGASNNCNYQTAGNYVSIQGATPGTPQTGNINISGTNIAAYFSGDGHLLSNINASNVTTGTINNLRLSNDVTLQGNSFNGANQLIQATAIGYIPALNGSLVTNLNASSINQGTLSDSRLSSNIPLKNASNTFTQNNTFSGGITTNSIQPSTSLTVGSTSNPLTLQGSSTTISSTNSGGTTTVGFNGTSSGSVNYQFDAATTPGTYFVCTTVGNCGTGSSLSGSGTTGTIALFNGTQSIGNSKLTQTGSNVSVAGNLTVAPTVNSASTFVIQDATANPLFTANTTNGRIGIGNSSPNYPLDVTGNINSSTGLYVNGTKVCDSTGCGSIGGSGFYIQNGTSNQTNANFNIQSSSSSSIVGILKGASGQSADLLDLQNSSGTNKVAFSASGNVNIAGAYQINGSQISSTNLSDSSNIGLLNGNQTYTGNNTLSGNSTFTGTVLQQNTSDSTAAFQIQNAAGTDNLFVADTTNSRIGIGTNTPGYTLDVNGNVNIAAGSNYLINGTPICSGAYLCAPSKESPYYVQNSTTQQADTNINIKSISASSVTATFSGTSGQSTDILDITNNSNSVVASFDKNGKLTSTGLTTSGADVNINASSNFNTNINTGSSTGTVSIGNSLSSLTLQGTGSPTLNAYAICTQGNLTTCTNYASSSSVTNLSNSLSSNYTNNTNLALNYAPISPSANGYVQISPASAVAGNINQSGSITGVGINSGTGQIQGTGGLSVSGATTNINANSNFNTNINTGSSTGTVSIGNSLSTISINGNTSTLSSVSTTNINSGNTSYSTNSVGQTSVGSIATITGAGTSFNSNMVGGIITINTTPTATVEPITGFTSSTVLTATGTTAISSGTTYSISYNNGGTVNIGNAAGSVAINGTISGAVNIGASGSLAINNASNSAFIQTSSSGSGTITIGTGSDTVAISSSGITLSGNARHSKTITLTPEYSGAVLDNGASFTQAPTNGSIGTMTAGFDTSTGTLSARPGENNYSWTTSQSLSQSYDVIIQVPIPSDFASFASLNPISIDTKGTASSTITAWLWNNNTPEAGNWNPSTSGCVIPVSTSWATQSSTSVCAITAVTDNSYNNGAGLMTFRIRLTAPLNGIVQLGNINISYKSSY